jgi:UDP-2,3-diacylglucosamine pyrophosphatase LpxH
MEHLYLVGDIIDVWVSVKTGKWSQSHTNVIRAILSKSQFGTNVWYTPGNHDAFLRRINRAELGKIIIDDVFIHETADGRKLYVTHGDLFDKSVHMLSVALIGTWLYEMMTVLNAWWNNRRVRSHKEPISLHAAVKKRMKKAVNRLTCYEDQLSLQASLEHCDGVVCGHIHRPMLKTMPDGTIYANSGDWVENGTALVEHFDGSLELLHLTEIRRRLQAAKEFDPSQLADPVRQEEGKSTDLQ